MRNDPSGKVYDQGSGEGNNFNMEAFLENVYGIKAHRGLQGELSHLYGSKPSFGEYYYLLDKLAKEMEKYPPETIKILNLDIFLVEDYFIYFNNQTYYRHKFSGTYSTNFKDPGPYGVRNGIALDVSVLVRSTNEWKSHVINHEITHALEATFGGVGEGDIFDNMDDDDRDNEYYFTDYATKSEREDIAEFGSCMMLNLLNPSNKDYQVLLHSDPQARAVFEKKYRAMKEFYNYISGGTMDDQYWQDLGAGKVGAGYWDK